jgi:hypothetical protein
VGKFQHSASHIAMSKQFYFCRHYFTSCLSSLVPGYFNIHVKYGIVLLCKFFLNFAFKSDEFKLFRKPLLATFLKI